jgi:hypothetical protein
MSDQIKFTPPTEVELNQVEHPAWDEPVICRVEVDLPGWLTKLTGQSHWEVYSEEEEENCISFAMRSSHTGSLHKAATAKKVDDDMQAEVTLYHNGYAVVDVDGKSLFDGALTNATNDCARLSYYHMSGEPIALN